MNVQKTRHTASFGQIFGGLLAALLVPVPSATGQTATAQLVATARLVRVSAAAAPCLNVRESPSYRAPIRGCVDVGTELSVSDESKGWSRVSALDGGPQGWAGSRFLEPGESPSEFRNDPPIESSGESISSIRIEPADLAAYAPESELNDREPQTVEKDQLAMRLASATRRIEELEAEIAQQARLGLDSDLLARTETERDEALGRLLAAEERVASLESELASLGDATSRIERLTLERDRLTRQLAQSEARQLYLQTDLEQTRAELMQLKGVPPRLVQLDPEPAPPPALEPEPEAAVAAEAQPAEEEVFQLPVSPDSFGLNEVVRTVRAWAQSWSEQRADDYLSFYSQAFTPPDGQSRDDWERMRRERISAPRSIDVSIEQIAPVISGDRAQVTFLQAYDSDTFSDVVAKSMVLELVEGTWRIVEERVES